MDFRKSRILMLTGFVVSIVIMLFGSHFENEKTVGVFLIMGTILFMISLFQALLFYRCPHCNYSLLNVRGGNFDYCPHCGESLKKEE